MRGLKPGGTMSAEMDALAVVNQLRDLAADPLNRRAIVEDQGCLPGLILFLDHPNPQVVYSALLVRHFHFAASTFVDVRAGLFIYTGINVWFFSFNRSERISVVCFFFVIYN